MTGITRRQAAEALAAYFGTSPQYLGTYYDTWGVTDPEGKVWKLMSDSSIKPEKKTAGGYISASGIAAHTAAAGVAPGVAQIHGVAGACLLVAPLGGLLDQQHPGALPGVGGQARLPVPGGETPGDLRLFQCLTAPISTSPNRGSGCSLSAILIPDAPAKYFLSSEMTQKLLYSSIESFSFASVRKRLAGESSAQEVKGGQVSGVDRPGRGSLHPNLRRRRHGRQNGAVFRRLQPQAGDRWGTGHRPDHST